MLTNNNKVININDYWRIPIPGSHFDDMHYVYTKGINGHINASPSKGRFGTTVTLTPVADYGYRFDSYTISGATLYDGNKFDITDSDVIVEGNFVLDDPTYVKPYTIRLKFTDGVVPEYIKGEWVQISSSPNIWDYTYNYHNWDGLLAIYYPELIEVLGANTTGVTSMGAMFKNCSKLTSVPLFDTSLVTNMSNMFYGCEVLSSIPLYDTSNVISMNGTFESCKAITTIPQFDTSKVVNMNRMFWNCDSLTSIPLIDTSNVEDMVAMFAGCDSLTTIPLIDTSKVTKAESLFSSCSSLTSVPLIDLSHVTSTYSMFSGCTALTSIPLLDISSSTNARNMFSGCTSLTTLPLLDTSKVFDFFDFCYNCTSLTSIPNLDFSSASNAISIPGTSNTYDGLDQAFYGCTSLSSIPSSITLGPDLKRLQSTFGKTAIEYLPTMNTSNIASIQGICSNCTSLKAIPLLDTSSCTRTAYAFDGCVNVESGAYALYQQLSSQTPSVNVHYYTFRNCGSNTTTGAAELAQIPSGWK